MASWRERERRHNFRAGTITRAIYASIPRKTRVKLPDPLDFFEPKQQQILKPEDEAKRIKAWAIAAGAIVVSGKVGAQNGGTT